MSTIQTAKVIFNQDGLPFSEEFADIYFEHNDKTSQTEEVFIKGNNIPQVWHEHSNEQEFVIAETGFGTGLNFLLTLREFIKFKQATNSSLKLRFISTEKFPLSHADLKQSLAALPELEELSKPLLSQYNFEQVVGSPMHFADGSVTLQIYFCDSVEGLKQIERPENGLIDAFYLDGFAPSRNPEMWSPVLFKQFARLAKKGASLSTFTVAGQVKRDLIAAGFKLKKQKHSKIKSETLTASYVGLREGKPLPGYKIRPKVIKPQHISIVGGGIASACMALAMVRRGIRVNLYCQDASVAQGASSNAIGAIYPLLHQSADPMSKFYQQSFAHALKLYQSLLEDGYHFSHGFDGVIDVCYKEPLLKRYQHFAEQNGWPEDLVRAVESKQVDQLANIDVGHPGLFFPKAGWVSPPELVRAILKAATDTGLCKIKTNHQVLSIKATAKQRWIITTNKAQKQVKHLILCPGADGLKMPILDDLPLSQVRGQVTQMQTNDKIGPLKTVLCHKGYLTPQNDGVHCIGATFDKNCGDTASRHEDDIYNLDKLTACLGNLGDWTEQDIKANKARLRCCTPDHMPIAGALPDIELHKQHYQHLSHDKSWHIAEPTPVVPGLYVLTGLGARGLCSAPLLADILACEICDETYPVDEEMLFNLSANRFIIRDIIRRKFE